MKKKKIKWVVKYKQWELGSEAIFLFFFNDCIMVLKILIDYCKRPKKKKKKIINKL